MSASTKAEYKEVSHEKEKYSIHNKRTSQPDDIKSLKRKRIITGTTTKNVKDICQTKE